MDVAREVWDATLNEVGKGWLEGPLTASEVSEKVGPLWTPSRRFGIVQGQKVRNIDDLSEFASEPMLRPQVRSWTWEGVDEVVSLAATWTRVFGGLSK